MTWPNEQYLFFQKGLSSADTCDGCGITFGADTGASGPTAPPPPPPGPGGGGGLLVQPCFCDETNDGCFRTTSITPLWGGGSRSVECCCYEPTPDPNTNYCNLYSGSASYQLYQNGSLIEERYMNFGTDAYALNPPISYDHVRGCLCGTQDNPQPATATLRYRYYQDGEITYETSYPVNLGFACPELITIWPSEFTISSPDTNIVNFGTRCDYMSNSQTKSYSSGGNDYNENLFQRISVSWNTTMCCPI
jgi:hypothetical protein